MPRADRERVGGDIHMYTHKQCTDKALHPHSGAGPPARETDLADGREEVAGMFIRMGPS